MIHFAPMKVETRRTEGIPVIAPAGRITIGEPAESLGRALNASIDGGAPSVIVDVSRVQYLDSSGIGELVAAARRLSERGGKLGLAAPGPKIKEMLEITQLWRIFPVKDSETELARELPGSGSGVPPAAAS